MSNLSSSDSRYSSATKYAAKANYLKQSLPHLKHTTETSRFQGSLVTVHDYDTAWATNDPIRIYLDFSNPAEDRSAQAFIRALRYNVGKATIQRVIIVEDLCHELLRLLERTFDLSPEVFEDYLVNSGWGPTGRYDDAEPTHWKTRRLRQEHCTLRWYRACNLTLRNLGEDSLKLSRDSILSTSSREVKTIRVRQGGVEKERKRLMQRDTMVATNIWRRHLDLRIKGDDFREGERLAWEERVLIWQRKEADVRFVILLLDPSPLAFTSESFHRETNLGLSEAWNYLGTTESAPIFDDTDTATMNLKSRSKPSFNDPEIDSAADDYNEAAQMPLPASTTSSEPRSVHSEPNVERHALASGAIFCSSDTVSHGSNINLGAQSAASKRSQVNNTNLNEDSILPVEPLHAMTMLKDGSEDKESRDHSQMVRSTNDMRRTDLEKANSTKSIKSTNNQRKRTRRSVSLDLTEPNRTAPHMNKTGRLFCEAKLGPRSSLGFLLRNVASRGPTQDVSVVPSRFDRHTFDKIFQETTSTAYDLQLWMDHTKTLHYPKMAGLGPVSTVFNIIGNDIEDFLLHYNDFLAEIENMSQDLDTVERRLPSWRNLMNCAANELRYLEEHLPALMAFLTLQPIPQRLSSSQSDLKPFESIFDVEGDLLHLLMCRIKQTQERTKHSVDALVAAVSFLESRQSISESRRVKLLTQLAFFFIPLSFSASFYGMQVKELPPTTTSIWQFFALSACLTFAAYLVYFLQSPLWKNFLYRQRHDFKRFTEKRYNFRDPEELHFSLTSFWRYLWEEKFAWMANLGSLTVIVIPIIPIWTSSLVQSIKLIVSLCLLLVLLLILAMANWLSISNRLITNFSSSYQVVGDVDGEGKEGDNSA